MTATRFYRTWWRKYGAGILVTLIIGSCFISLRVSGFFILGMITVPCGVRIVNTNKTLWVLRQAYFLSSGLYLIFF